MPVEIPSVPPQPESIGRSTESAGPEQVKPLDQKIEEVAEKPLGVLPEGAPSGLSQRQISVVSEPLPKEMKGEDVAAALTSIMEEKGITKSAEVGIEVVAERCLYEEINSLLETGGYSPLCPEYDVQTVHGEQFPKVDIIFTESGVTIAGIEEQELPAFLEEIGVTNPDLQEQLTSFVNEGKVGTVSKDMVSGIEQIAEDRFSEIASELRERVTTFEEGPEKAEVEEKESSSEEELGEPDEGEEEGEEVSSAEVSESSEEDISDVDEVEEGTETEEETEEHHPPVHISRMSVEAKLVDSVAEQILQKFIAVSWLGSQIRQEHQIQQEERVKEKHEQEEEQIEEMKRKDKQERIRKEQEQHIEQEQAIEKSSTKKSELAEKVVSRESGKQEERHDIGEVQEKQKQGIPTPPPGIPLS